MNSRRVFKHTSALVVLMPQITSRGRAVSLGIKLEASFFSPCSDCYLNQNQSSLREQTEDSKSSKAKGQARVKLNITTLKERTSALESLLPWAVLHWLLCSYRTCQSLSAPCHAEKLPELLWQQLDNSTVPGMRGTWLCCVELLETSPAFSCCYDRTCE